MLVAVSVAVPILAQAMDLSISQPVGFAGLAICFGVLGLGVALIFAPQPKPAPTKREFFKSQLQNLYADLGAHLNRALALKADEEVQTAIDDFTKLLGIAVDWIGRNMGRAAVQRFLVPGNPLQYGWEGEHTPEALALRSRLIDTLKARLANVSALIESDHWDQPA